MNYTKNMRYERQVMFNKIGKEKQKLIEDIIDSVKFTN